MEIKASINDLRMSPRKVRLVIDLIRKMPVDAALAQLKFTNKLATEPVAKMIESAIANGIKEIADGNLDINIVYCDNQDILNLHNIL